MKFCSHCGAPLQGDERFCVACGTPVSANAAALAPGPVAGTTAPPVSVLPLPTPPAVPGSYAASGPIPVAVGTPEAPANRGGKMWTVIVIAAILALGYYYSKQKPAAATPPAVPAQPGAPAQPGVPAQPESTGSLVQQQSFSAHWRAIYGYVGVTNATWTNHSTVAVQSAVLECDQYAANGADLSQTRMTLNGPVKPGGTTSFNPFQMGAVATYMSTVKCAIVAVTPAN